jgi:hypothetical protein
VIGSSWWKHAVEAQEKKELEQQQHDWKIDSRETPLQSTLFDRIHSALCIMAFVRSTFLWWLQYKHTLLSLQEAIHARDTKPAHKTKQQKPAHKTKQQKLEGLSLDPHCWIYDTFLIPACNCSP